MADNQGVREFPDVSQKLAAPKKLSAYEKEKQAAEAKRQRAAAEDAAALREFEREFANDDDDRRPQHDSRGGGPRPYQSGSYGSSNYGPGPQHGYRGAYGQNSLSRNQPPSMKRKREPNAFREPDDFRRGPPTFDRHGSTREPNPMPRRKASRDEDEEDEEELPKPVIYLSMLPPGVTSEQLKSVLTPHLKVHAIRFAPPPPGVSSGGKKSAYAVVTLVSETTPAQIDAAINVLQDSYLNCGFKLCLTRHQSSSNMHPSITGNKNSDLFGARTVRQQPSRPAYQHARPPEQRRFAPPEQYEPQPHQFHRNSDREVTAAPPSDIAMMRAIHTVADRLLSEPNIDRALEVEALLMALPEVQNDQRFSFLYDSQSPAGVYYRHCLWKSDSTIDKHVKPAAGRLHRDIGITWQHPGQRSSFANLTQVADVVDDPDYISSEEESGDEDLQARNQEQTGQDGMPEQEARMFLTVLQRARFAHLLARLPPVNSRLRKGDIARVTHFAITHAGSGIEEMVDMLILNVDIPFCNTLAARYEQDNQADSPASLENPGLGMTSMDIDQPTPEQRTEDTQADPSSAKLVALYVISDILSSSSIAGTRNAWKYRQLLEAGFRERKTFERLGKLGDELGWGKMKAQQWKRRLGALFELWENWSAFPSNVLQYFRRAFSGEPEEANEKKAAESVQDQTPKWLKFQKTETAAPSKNKKTDQNVEEKPDQEADIKDKTMTDLNSSDPVPMATQDAVLDTSSAPQQPEEATTKTVQAVQPTLVSDAASTVEPPKKRMKAEDMFAEDSDE